MAMTGESEMAMKERQRLEQIRSNWWILLLNGILSVAAGIIILSIQWTLPLLAYFVGAVLIVRGILQAFSPPFAGSSTGWNITAGIVSALVGLAIVSFPSFAALSLLTLAIFIGAWFTIWGISTIAGSIANRRRAPHWWLSLIGGALSTTLGIFALYRPILTLELAIGVFGIWAIVVGAMEIGLSFEIRSMPQLMEEMAMETAPTAIEIERMASLRDKGVVSSEEFEQFKKKKIA